MGRLCLPSQNALTGALLQGAQQLAVHLRVSQFVSLCVDITNVNILKFRISSISFSVL